jgi:hypothetical protein
MLISLSSDLRVSIVFLSAKDSLNDAFLVSVTSVTYSSLPLEKIEFLDFGVESFDFSLYSSNSS